MSRRIVVYYSLTDNTKEAAEYIAAKLGAEIVRLNTVKKMPTQGAKMFLTGGSQATIGIKPKLQPIEIDFAAYDEIIIGMPIWAGKQAPAFNTFLKDSSIRNKVHGVFTLSGGGDNDKCLAALKKQIPDIKWSVALADKRVKAAEKNKEAMDKFTGEIING